MIFDRDNIAPNLASCVIIDFKTAYTGPSFYGENEPVKRGWVPIFPVVAEWNTVRNGETQSNSRKMCPFRLCYAQTILKAQGRTIKGKVVVHLGKEEKEHGLTYTAFSRVTRFSDIGIADGFTAERLTSKIRKNKKVKPRMMEERKSKEKRKNTSISLLQHQIMRLLERSNQIYDELSKEHRTYFDKSIEQLTSQVGEGQKFTWIRQAEQHISNYA